MASLIGCSQDAQSASNENEEEENPTIVFPVQVASAELGSISAFFTGTATLEAEEEALVVAKAGGVVEEILVEEGHYVQAGQVLARLEREQARLEVARLEANLSKLENDLQRNKDLFDKQLISTQAYEQIKFDYASQKAAHDLAKLQVEYGEVRAPISGIISERLVKVGNMVGLNAPTFRITDFNPLLAILHVPERELSKLEPGQATILTVDATPGEVFEGRIERVSPVVDPATGTFKVTVEVRDRTRRLKPGMLARVSITYDVRNDALLIPKEAVLIEDSEPAVFVVNDDTAFRIPVAVGYTDASFTQIMDGLDSGMTVVTVGQNSLKDSTHVEIIQ